MACSTKLGANLFAKSPLIHKNQPAGLGRRHYGGEIALLPDALVESKGCLARCFAGFSFFLAPGSCDCPASQFFIRCNPELSAFERVSGQGNAADGFISMQGGPIRTLPVCPESSESQ